MSALLHQGTTLPHACPIGRWMPKLHGCTYGSGSETGTEVSKPGHGIEIRYAMIRLHRRRGEVVAQTQVQRQLQRHLPVVLDEPGRHPQALVDEEHIRENRCLRVAEEAVGAGEAGSGNACTRSAVLAGA
jgi:hypothetical protein